MTHPNTQAEALAKAGIKLGIIETPSMRGDNLAVTLCSHFEDADGEKDDNGWTEAATTGCDEVLEAIHQHYVAALTQPIASAGDERATDILTEAMDNAHAFDPGEVVVPYGEAMRALAALSQPIASAGFPQPQRRDGKEPCGECHLKLGETCDICGAKAEAALTSQPPASREDREPLKDVTVHLIAAVSLLEKYHEACAPSKRDALFGTKIKDYKRAIENGRAAAFASEPAPKANEPPILVSDNRSFTHQLDVRPPKTKVKLPDERIAKADERDRVEVADNGKLTTPPPSESMSEEAKREAIAYLSAKLKAHNSSTSERDSVIEAVMKAAEDWAVDTTGVPSSANSIRGCMEDAIRALKSKEQGE